MEIEQRIHNLLKQTITEKNKKKRSLLFHEIFILNEYANCFYNKDFKKLWMNCYRNEDYFYSKKQQENNQQIFLSVFNQERNYHNYFASNTIVHYYQYPDELKSFYFKQTLSKEAFFEILENFFKEELTEFYPIYDQIIKEKRLFFVNKNMFDKNSIGLTRYLSSSKKSIIFIQKEYTLKNLVTAVHEIGHAIHYDFMKDNYYSLSKSYFSEVFSYTIEQIFLSYLQGKNLLKEECNQYQKSLAILLFNRAQLLYIVSNLTNFSVDELYNIKTSKEEMYEQLKDHLTSSTTLENLNLRNILLYYYGIFFSYEFLSRYEENKEKTIKQFQIFLSTKTLENLEDFFNIFELNYEDGFTNTAYQKQIIR